jgi:hypothetical protein
MTFRTTTDPICDGGKIFFGNSDKLIVEENYLAEQIFNMEEDSLQIPERTFIHKEANSMPGFKVCVSTL